MGAYGGAAPPYETRRLRPDEWRELRELRLDSLRTDPLAFGSTLARELAYPESTWVMRVGAGATSRTTSTWVVTDAAGRLVGLTTVSEVEARLTIFGTWVAVPHRRKGLAGLLLDAALGWAEASTPLRPVWPRGERETPGGG